MRRGVRGGKPHENGIANSGGLGRKVYRQPELRGRRCLTADAACRADGGVRTPAGKQKQRKSPALGLCITVETVARL